CSLFFRVNKKHIFYSFNNLFYIYRKPPCDDVIITTHLDVFLTIIMWVCTLIDMVFNTHILHLAVGAPSKQCWGVTYSSNSICVLNGSSVDISCTYKYPRDHRISTIFWFYQQISSHLPVDLRLGEDYQNHTE